MTTLDMFLDYFNIGEKDIIMILIFITMFVSMILCWALEDAQKWYRRNRQEIRGNVEYILKITFIPVLSLILCMKGFDKTTRKKYISYFLYA